MSATEWHYDREIDHYLQGIVDALDEAGKVILPETVYDASDKRYTLEQVKAWFEETNNG